MRGVGRAAAGRDNQGLPELRNPSGRDHNKEDRRKMKIKMTAAAVTVATVGVLAGCGTAPPVAAPVEQEQEQVGLDTSRYPQLARDYWRNIPLPNRENMCRVWVDEYGGADVIRDGWFDGHWALPEEDKQISVAMWEEVKEILNEECR